MDTGSTLLIVLKGYKGNQWMLELCFIQSGIIGAAFFTTFWKVKQQDEFFENFPVMDRTTG